MKKYLLALSVLVTSFSMADNAQNNFLGFKNSNTMNVENKVELQKEDVAIIILNQKDRTFDEPSQAGLALFWYQASGEARALYQQGFNVAKAYYDSVKVPEGMKKAVVVDIDETMLDNSDHGAWQFAMDKNFNSAMWTKWVNSQRAIATQGAIEFNNYVVSHGGVVFYVSNRKESTELDATIKNMSALGFKGIERDRFFFKTDSSKKEARYTKIKAMGYDIVQYIGDNLNDFTDATYHKSNIDRKKWVNENSHLFGTKYIIMPNPLYGGFMDTHSLQGRYSELRLTDWYK